jgi:hypothetical protein
MSDLPESIGRPHRAAHRNYDKSQGSGKDAMNQKVTSVQPGKQSRKSKPKADVVEQQAGDHERMQGLKQVDPVEFNQQAEPAAVDYLADYVRRKGPPSFNTACSLIALEAGVSTETAKRWLRKHSVDHPRARFEIGPDSRVYLRKAE